MRLYNDADDSLAQAADYDIIVIISSSTHWDAGFRLCPQSDQNHLGGNIIRFRVLAFGVYAALGKGNRYNG